MSIKESNGKFDNCQFINNEAKIFSQNVFLSFSNLSIIKTTFQATKEKDPYSLVQNSLIYGTFFYVSLGVTMTITDSSFTNGISEQGGAIYLSGLSSL